MMRNTPRTFVGSVVFLLDGPVDDRLAGSVCPEVRRLPGIGRCELDLAAGTLVVTAESAVDRADIVAVLDRIGCRVR
jgi:hypothetical protein